MEKAIAFKAVLEHDLLSKVEISPDFPLTDETALILLRFTKQLRLTVGDEPMKVSPHVAAYKSSVTDVKLYSARSYNQSSTEFLRMRLANFEARGLIEKAGIEVTQTSPVLIVRHAGKEPRFVVDLSSLNDCLSIQCFASIAVKDQMRFVEIGRWQISIDLVEAYSQIPLRKSDRNLFAFSTPFGIYVPTRMIMGDPNAPGKFLKVVKILFETVEGSSNYMDNITISDDKPEIVLKSFIDCLLRAEKHNAFLKPSKTKIGTRETDTLG